MSDLNYAHQRSIFDPRHARSVTVIGVGAVGGWVAKGLPKLGVRDLSAYDHDFVASHNIPMSVYSEVHLGKYKVDVLAQMIEAETQLKITALRKRYEGEPLRTSAVISCVDHMGEKHADPLQGRRLVWSKVKRNPRVELFLDTRTAGAFVEVFAIEPNRDRDIDRYEKLLFDDKDGANHTCGNHGVIYGSEIAAAAVHSRLTTYWTTGSAMWRFAMRCDTLEPA